jgi:hypothetical protein
MSDDVAARARYCRESGNFDALHGELLGEVERLRNFRSRLEAFGRDCLHHGDITPGGKRMLDSIAELLGVGR